MRMFSRFSLVLVVNHACNLRCSYCYTGAKFRRRLPHQIAVTSIDRAIRSIAPAGTLELGFFGGEPLLEAEQIDSLIDYAHSRAACAGTNVTISLTTNGTIDSHAAWRVMQRRDVELNFSHDGLPDVHDRHRIGIDGLGTSDRVIATIRRLLAAGREVRAVMVVRPDTADRLPDGVRWLRHQGVRHVTPSLDIWAKWSRADLQRLVVALGQLADVWREGLPDCSVSWFDEKAARLTRVPCSATARCGFGVGEIAVAPSGNLYPCERLVGEDRDDNPNRMPGHALEGADFCAARASPARFADPCADCAIESICGTTCRCSNYVRTGNVRQPDALLCTLESACYRETSRVLADLQHSQSIRPFTTLEIVHAH
jgi:uncharacterized protein